MKIEKIVLKTAKLVEEQQTNLRNHFERNLISELEKRKNEEIVELKKKQKRSSKGSYAIIVQQDCLTHLKIKTIYFSHI